MKTLLITWLTLHFLTSFTISGTVHDASDNQPLPYTHITVFDENRQHMITGGVSDLDGYFSIEVDASSLISLRISAIGYETLWMNVDPENTNLNISLTPISIEGDELVIMARPIPAIIRADHIRYYPTSEQLQSASSALEVLRFLPGVQVDLFQQVTLDGNSDVLILVDGMQRDRQYLQQIPPSRIERIEVLPMPPAAYRATSSGAINVILRPLADYHLGLRAHAEAPTRRNEQFLFPNASISYNKRAFMLNTSYAGERTQFNIRENQEVHDRIADSHVRSEQSLLQSGNSHRFTGTMRYQASESAAVEVYGWFSAYGQTHNGDARIQDNDGDWHLSSRGESDRNRAALLSSNVRYTTENHVITTEYSHYEMHATSKIDFPGLELTSSISPRERTRVAKLDVESTRESLVRLQYGLSGNQLERIFSDENSEMIWAGYVSASHRRDRNEFQGGIRTEYHSIFGWYFLPSMVWHHRFSDQRASFRAAYRSSVVQPHVYQRLGEQMWDDTLNFAGGNPDLKASLHRTVQLELSGNMGSAMMSLRYTFRHEEESLQRRISAAPHGGIQSDWYNAKYAWNHGLRLTGMMAFSPKLGLQLWAEPGQAGFEDGNSWYFSGGGSAYWQVTEPLTVAFMLNHEGKRIGSERTHYSGTLYFINATVRPSEGVSIAAVSGIPFTRSFVYDGFRATTSEMDVRSEGQILMSTVPVWFTLTIDINRGSNSIARRGSTRNDPEVVRRNKKGL